MSMKTQAQLEAESLETVRKLRNSVIGYLGMMSGSMLIFIIILGWTDPSTDMSMLTVGSLPGYFAVCLCILGLVGLLGATERGYRLWSFIHVFRT